MDLKETFKDIDILQEAYDKMLEEASPEELKEILNNSKKLYFTLYDELKIRSYEKYEYHGKFIKINGAFGEESSYMYVIAQTMTQKENVTDSTITLWGVYFSWEEGPYVDMAWSSFDAYKSIEIRLEWIKEHEESTDPDKKPYIEIITEEE